ncbi:MAG: hypothetical protein JWM34_4208 [Ilumatobacteraceae bacterium]|nr:hypothetical protein [Ilumatobacteraceae bacterium]
MTPFDRRSFLLASGALALAACGSSKGGSSSSGVTKDNTLVARFALEMVIPGTSRMPFSLGTSSTVLSTGPKTLTAKIVDANNKVVVPSISAKQRRVNEGIVYWDFHPTLTTVGQYTIILDGGDPHGTAISVNDPSTVPIPYPGQQLPPFDTPTTANTGGVNPICTRLTGGPCPFHSMTLTQALATGKPVAYLIGTPAHCQFGTCGPGLEFLMTSAKRLGDKVVPIHAEVYTDDTATVTTPAVDAYKLTGEPDLWLADKSGKIVTRFDGAWDQSELDEALNALVA